MKKNTAFMILIVSGILISAALFLAKDIFAQVSEKTGFDGIYIDNETNYKLFIKIDDQNVTVPENGRAFTKGQGLAPEGSSYRISVAKYAVGRKSVEPLSVHTGSFKWRRV